MRVYERHRCGRFGLFQRLNVNDRCPRIQRVINLLHTNNHDKRPRTRGLHDARITDQNGPISLHSGSPSLILRLDSISATSGVSTSSAPNMAADPGEPMGSVLPGKVSSKNAALSSRYA